MHDIPFGVIDGIEMDEFDAKAAGTCNATLKKIRKGKMRDSSNKQNRRCTRNMPVWQSSTGHCPYSLNNKWKQ